MYILRLEIKDFLCHQPWWIKDEAVWISFGFLNLATTLHAPNSNHALAPAYTEFYLYSVYLEESLSLFNGQGSNILRLSQGAKTATRKQVTL